MDKQELLLSINAMEGLIDFKNRVLAECKELYGEDFPNEDWGEDVDYLTDEEKSSLEDEYWELVSQVKKCYIMYNKIKSFAINADLKSEN